MEGLGITYLGFSLEVALMLVGTSILLCISALVSGSEVAFFALTPKELSLMREGSNQRDKAILACLDDVEGLLATILVTNNLVNICIVILTSKVMDLLFVFNWHPTASIPDYELPVQKAGKYVPILSTDEKRFGGHATVDMEGEHFSFNVEDEEGKKWPRLKIYNVARTATVFLRKR